MKSGKGRRLALCVLVGPEHDANLMCHVKYFTDLLGLIHMSIWESALRMFGKGEDTLEKR